MHVFTSYEGDTIEPPKHVGSGLLARKLLRCIVGSSPLGKCSPTFVERNPPKGLPEGMVSLLYVGKKVSHYITQGSAQCILVVVTHG